MEEMAGMKRLLIEYFTLQRSGSHAIANWLFNQFDEEVLFFNNAKPGLDPAEHMRNPDIDLENIINLSTYWINPEERKKLHLHPAKTIAVGFENYDFIGGGAISIKPVPEKSIQGWIKPIKRIRLIILRDFFNWLASDIHLRMKKDSNFTVNVEHWKNKIELWKIYAREYNMKPRFLTHPNENVTFIPVSYNRWRVSREYRESILFPMFIELVNDNMDFIPRSGGGSSFDARSFQGAASKMEVDKRHEILNTPMFDDLMEFAMFDKELLRLNREIFGEKIYNGG